MTNPGKEKVVQKGNYNRRHGSTPSRVCVLRTSTEIPGWTGECFSSNLGSFQPLSFKFYSVSIGFLK